MVPLPIAPGKRAAGATDLAGFDGWEYFLTLYLGPTEDMDMSIVPDGKKTDRQILGEAIAEGRKPDPEVVKRVRERSASLRKKFDKELSVELIRSARDE